MKGFRVTGHFEMGLNKEQAFTVEVAAADEATARETIYSRIGSKHRAPRKKIHITAVTAPDPEELTDGAVRHQLGLGKKAR